VHIAPLFSAGQILDQSLCDLRPGHFIERLNQELYDKEQSPIGPKSPVDPDERPPTRHGKYLANDDYGLLITDMTPGPDVKLLEFKPKWLVQSPNAPRDSIRCRTCALRARRDYHRLRKVFKTGPLSDEDVKSSGFCPLHLMSSSNKIILRNVRHLLASELSKDLLTETIDNKLVQRFCEFIKSDPIFSKLAARQTELDSRDVLFRYGSGPNAPSEREINNLLIAMTLRDCSLFLHMPLDPAKPITARAGDLDMKSRLKINTWGRKERELIDEGWYQGTETYSEEELKAGLERPKDCMLNLGFW
jgi:inositol-pentakisphosphate 2-kinase